MTEEHSIEFRTLEDVFKADLDGILDTPKKPPVSTSTDRIIESFKEINEFYRINRKIPSSETTDIVERKLGARLEGFRLDGEKRGLLSSLDEFELLGEETTFESIDQLLGNFEALDSLSDPSGILDVSSLPKRASRIEPEEVAKKTRCSDFEAFAPLFKQKHEELRNGDVKLIPFGGEATVVPGAFFVLSGVMCFVADLGEELKVAGKRTRHKRRTRTIYENGTESSLFGRSLASQLYENDGFQVVPARFEALLADDEATGWVYVLRSLSEDPLIAGIENLFKIGFSTTPVAKRVANARNETTYLMAPVEIVAEYRTYNLKTAVLEHLLHRVFVDARLNVGQVGKDGKIYEPKEWFIVPLKVVNQAIQMIATGDILDYLYDSNSSRLLEAKERPML